MVHTLPRVVPPEGVCKGCVLCKHHQEKFEIGKYWKAKAWLELMHNDICIINHHSLENVGYILTFIGDFSNLTWVYFLMEKDMIFEKFKQMWST